MTQIPPLFYLDPPLVGDELFDCYLLQSKIIIPKRELQFSLYIICREIENLNIYMLYIYCLNTILCNIIKTYFQKSSILFANIKLEAIWYL